MAFKDAMIVLLALALPIWLVVEQVVWWASTRNSQAEIRAAAPPVEPRAKKARVATRKRPTFPSRPRKVA